MKFFNTFIDNIGSGLGALVKWNGALSAILPKPLTPIQHLSKANPS
jgi:hypothetical protein